MKTIEQQAKLTEKHEIDNQTADGLCKRFSRTVKGVIDNDVGID